jgi:hypothetical protein
VNRCIASPKPPSFRILKQHRSTQNRPYTSGYFNGHQVLSCEARASHLSCLKLRRRAGPSAPSSPGRISSTTQSTIITPCPAAAKLAEANCRADHTEDFDFCRHLSACPVRPRCTPTSPARRSTNRRSPVSAGKQAPPGVVSAFSHGLGRFCSLPRLWLAVGSSPSERPFARAALARAVPRPPTG